MKKSSFITLILGTVSGVLFALGMCMALIPEWNAFRPGVVFGCLGAVMALGVSGALLCVAGVAAGGVLGLFRGQGGLEAAIQDSMDRGRAFIDGALEAGRSLLDQLLPW